MTVFLIDLILIVNDTKTPDIPENSSTGFTDLHNVWNWYREIICFSLINPFIILTELNLKFRLKIWR